MTWNLTSVTAARNFFDTRPKSVFQSVNQMAKEIGPAPLSFIPPASISEFILLTGPGGGLTAEQRKAKTNVGATVKAILNEMARPVEKGKNLTRSITFPFSFSFKFPYRKTRRHEWKLWDFIMLRGTKVTYAVRYKKKGDVLLRRTSLVFKGPSPLNGGFWGPFKGDESGKEVFPDQRMDQIDLLEAFSVTDGKPVAHFTIKDYSGNRKRIPYKIKISVSLHDEEDGKNDGCHSFIGQLISKLVKAKCIEYRNEEVLRFNFSRQVYSIFEHVNNLKLHDGGNNILTEAKKVYTKNSSATRGSDLTMIMGYLWQSGIIGGQKAFTSRITGMEKTL